MSVKEVGYFSRKSSHSIRFFSNDYFIDESLLIIRLSSLQHDFEKSFPFLHKGIPAESESLIDFWLDKKREEISNFYLHKGRVVIIADIIPNLFYYSELQRLKRKIDLLAIFLADQYSLNYEAFNGDIILKDAILNEITKKAENSFAFVYSHLPSNFKILATTVKTKNAIAFMTNIHAGRLLVLNKVDFDGFDVSAPTFFDWFVNEVMIILNSQDQDLTEIVSNQPAWLKNFKFDKESELTNDAIRLEEEILLKQSELNNVNIEINDYQILKATLFTNGSILEVAVGKCLEKLGINHFYPEGSETDLIIEQDEYFIAVEIKGTIGSVTLKHTRQLEDWVNRTAIKYDRDEVKGLLIMNSHNNLPLEERSKIVTPPNILEFSIARKHCILNTSTLIIMLQDFENGIIDKNYILNLISDCDGLLKYPVN